MRQRHVVAYLWLIALTYFVTMVAGYLVMGHLRPDKLVFVEPVIWHQPYTGGEEQLQPDI